MLIYRRGSDVVSARPDSLTDVGKVTNGAADIWILTTWLPRGVPASPVTAAAAESAGAGAEGPLYVQVSTSQNPEWPGLSPAIPPRRAWPRPASPRKHPTN